jgi:hypothetical protein
MCDGPYQMVRPSLIHSIFCLQTAFQKFPSWMTSKGGI